MGGRNPEAETKSDQINNAGDARIWVAMVRSGTQYADMEQTLLRQLDKDQAKLQTAAAGGAAAPAVAARVENLQLNLKALVELYQAHENNLSTHLSQLESLDKKIENVSKGLEHVSNEGEEVLQLAELNDQVVAIDCVIDELEKKLSRARDIRDTLLTRRSDIKQSLDAKLIKYESSVENIRYRQQEVANAIVDLGLADKKKRKRDLDYKSIEDQLRAQLTGVRERQRVFQDLHAQTCTNYETVQDILAVTKDVELRLDTLTRESAPDSLHLKILQLLNNGKDQLHAILENIAPKQHPTPTTILDTNMVRDLCLFELHTLQKGIDIATEQHQHQHQHQSTPDQSQLKQPSSLLSNNGQPSVGTSPVHALWR